MKRSFVFLSCLFVWMVKVKPVVLFSEKGAKRLLAGKICGVYNGSFDPFHNGHDSVIQQALDNGCDFVLAYANFGGDDNWKKRTNIKFRNKALLKLFAKHPRVIVTELDPGQLQETLMERVDNNTRQMRPKFNVTYICLQGSDAILQLAVDSDAVRKYLKNFMKGNSLADEHRQTSLGGLFALYTISFWVFLRNPHTKEEIIRAFSRINAISEKSLHFNFEVEDCFVDERPLEKILPPVNDDCALISSTKIKSSLKEHSVSAEDVCQFMSPIIYGIVRDNDWYRTK